MKNRREITLTLKPDTRGYCKLRKASEYIGVGIRSMRTYIKDYELPHHKLPTGTLLFSYADLDRWLNQYQVQNKAAQMADEIVKGL